MGASSLGGGEHRCSKHLCRFSMKYSFYFYIFGGLAQ